MTLYKYESKEECVIDEMKKENWLIQSFLNIQKQKLNKKNINRWHPKCTVATY